jgi:myo-inositol 2-dehydrogenase/D-chiro-inositol 1-dehydrogenase
LKLLKLAVVGAGRLGRVNTRRALETGLCRLVGAADLLPDAAEAFTRDYGGEPFADTAPMLDATRPDALLVTTIPTVRREPILAAAACGIAVFVEKPPAMDREEARVCCEALAAAGVVTACGFQGRYSAGLQRARELLAGRPLQVALCRHFGDHYRNPEWPRWYVQKRFSGGPFCEQVIHGFDAMRFLHGEITHVAAVGAHRVVSPSPEADAEDTVAFTFRFADGALGSGVNGCANAQTEAFVEFVGPETRLRVGWFGGPVTGRLGDRGIEENPPDDLARDKIASFLTAVRTGDRSLIKSDYADGARTLAVSLAATASLETGREEPVS